MNNYQLINERWQAYLGEQTLEEQFNRELNKLLKELQVLREAAEPGMLGKIGQKIGQFIKSSLDKISAAIKKGPKLAVSLVTKLVAAAGTFLKDPKNRAKIISAIKAVGVMALLAAAFYSPEAHAKIVDPETGKLLGGADTYTNAIRGALAIVADGLETITKTDIDPRAMALKHNVLELISKINSPQTVEITGLEKYILKIAQTCMGILRDADKETGGNEALKHLLSYGKSFQDFLITKVQGAHTEYVGKLPGEARGIEAYNFSDLAASAGKAMLKK